MKAKRGVLTIVIAIILITGITVVIITTTTKYSTPPAKKNINPVSVINTVNIVSAGCSNDDLIADQRELVNSNRINVISEYNAQIEAKAKLDAQTKLVAQAKEEADAKAAAAQVKQPINTPAPTPTQAVTPKKSRPTIPNNFEVEYLTQVENDIVSLCNVERAKVGRGPLANNEILRQIGEYKSDEMLQYSYISHPSPITGFSPRELGSTFGWECGYYGENILNIVQGGALQLDVLKATTAQEIFTGWMNSPEHKANMLSGNYSKIGVGIAFSTSGKIYASQEFSS